MKPDYCTNPNAQSCLECSLNNYGRDCLNNPVNQAASDSTNMDMLEKGLVQPEDL